ncbi:alpha/beta hydrolase [Nocardia donostiensis]|uniref:Alpha/beta hydrolase n=1 Tax=Nocardia donostiensis TaxID=1538463 RepID=A0A1W0BK30_9NOCA|nr:alpha/beta hydrolase [Nocardia donostiensis]ONM48901.1 alpha/beta hydrolase [Nocardia donostiensis]OQS22843.1 alpha/beta hydrolase [Nocardia donostiensis]
MHSSYLAFLPSDLHPDPDLQPVSTWWNRCGDDVHIERTSRVDADVRMLLVHGAGGHAAAMWPFAALAAEQGFEVSVPDMPGYGRTRVRNKRGIRYPDWVDCLTDLIRDQYAADPRPLVVLGASMGGMLAYEAAARTGLAAVVGATCLLDPRLPQVRAAIARRPWLGRYGPRLLSPAVDGLRVPMRWMANMGAMSNDSELTQVVATDTRGGGVSMPLGFLRTYLQSVPQVEPEAFTTCPVWLVHPGADAWTPLSLSETFFNRIAAPTKLIVLDNAGHYPIETPGIHQLVRALADLREEVGSSDTRDR